MKVLDTSLFKGRINDLMNIDVFIQRVGCLVEEYSDIPFGHYVTKVYAHGHIKVLKSLGLYKTIGRGSNKRIMVDDMLDSVIRTTLCENEVAAKEIIAMMNGGISGKRLNITNDLSEWLLLSMDCKMVTKGGYNTYVFYSPRTGMYKIGRSHNVLRRFESVKIDCGDRDLVLVAVRDGDIESMLHTLFYKYRVLGEWFKMSNKEIDQMISKHGFVYS